MKSRLARKILHESVNFKKAKATEVKFHYLLKEHQIFTKIFLFQRSFLET